MFLLRVLILLLACTAVQAQQRFDTLEEFFAIEEEEITIVYDLFVGDVYAGDVLITSGGGWYQVADVDMAMSQLPELTQPDAVRAFLEQRINGTSSREDGVAEITVEESFFRVNLSLAADVLAAKNLSADGEILPPPDYAALRSNFRVTGITGNNSRATALSFFHDTQPSKGKYRLDWRGSLDRGAGYNLQALAGVHETGQQTTEVGLLRTRGQRFVSAREFMGLEVGSTQETLYDDRLAQGSFIEIYVPQRGRVNIFRDEQLISTQLLDFGLQQLDTSRFPQGSYEVRIEIEQPDGTFSSENRLFTKTTNIVPRGKPEWFFQAGVIREQVDAFIESPVAQGGYRKRVSDAIELGGSFYFGRGLASFEPTIELLYRNLEAQAALNLTPSGDLGWAGFMRYYTPYGNFNFNVLESISGFTEAESTRKITDLRSAQTIATRQYTAAYNHNIGKLNFGVRGTYRRRGEDSTRSYDLRARYPLLQDNKQRLELTGNYGQNEGQTVTGMFLNYRILPFEDWQYNAQLGSQQLQGGREQSLRQNVVYDDRPSSIAKGNKLELNSAFIREGGEENRLTHDAEWERWSNHARTSLSVQDTRLGRNGNQRFGLQAETGFVHVGGKNYFTSSARGQSAYVVQLKGNAKQIPMKVTVNNAERTVVRAGDTVVLPLNPFETFQVAVAPQEEDELVSYPRRSHTISVFPGTVGAAEFVVNQSVLLFGQLLGVDGRPMKYAPVHIGDRRAITDLMGNFEIEVTGHHTPYVQTDTHQCTFALPHMEKSTYFVNVGAVVCL